MELTRKLSYVHSRETSTHLSSPNFNWFEDWQFLVANGPPGFDMRLIRDRGPSNIQLSSSNDLTPLLSASIKSDFSTWRASSLESRRERSCEDEKWKSSRGEAPPLLLLLLFWLLPVPWNPAVAVEIDIAESLSLSLLRRGCRWMPMNATPFQHFYGSACLRFFNLQCLLWRTALRSV